MRAKETEQQPPREQTAAEIDQERKQPPQDPRRYLGPGRKPDVPKREDPDR
jgi:hypothetical protein